MDKENIIYEYTDKQAIDDGVIHRFFVNGKEIPQHRITNNALEAIKEKYNKDDGQALEFVFYELMPLIPYAFKMYVHGDLLATDYNFKVGKFRHSQIIWFIPNENKGITVMKPEDY